jgi:hypothetical protein
MSIARVIGPAIFETRDFAAGVEGFAGVGFITGNCNGRQGIGSRGTGHRKFSGGVI